MATHIDIKEKIEDNALKSVPQDQRQGWLKITWNTAGIVTTLIQIFFGALATFVAGFKIAFWAGVTVTFIGSFIGWLCGHIAYKTGLSSTVMARKYGYGVKGSIIASIIFAFMIIGFLALENALLYEGFKFYLGFEDSIANKVWVYGILSIAWIFLTLYGFQLVSKVSSIMLTLFLLLLVYMTYSVLALSGLSLSQVTSFTSIFPPEVLSSMKATTDTGKFIFCVNLFIGSAGALALVDADLGRYAKKSSDIGIAAFIGLAAMDILMVIIGGMVMYAGSGKLVEHYVGKGIATDVAQKMALSPDGVAAAFMIFGGLVGFILMVLAQGKAQVLNTYSGSLSLSNLFDAIGFKQPRWMQVIFANIIGLIMVMMNILGLVQSWVNILGVLTTTFAGVMITDFFLIHKQHDSGKEQTINWSGVITTILATWLAHYVLNTLIPVEFISSLCISIILYYVLRKIEKNYVLKPKLCIKTKLE